MDTNPEEFNFGIHEKWADIIRSVCKRIRKEENSIPFLNDDEVGAVYNKLISVERDEFTAKVLRILANTPKMDYEQLNLPYMPGIRI